MKLQKTISKITGIEKADFRSNITVKYIMELLQKIATEHADEHGFGYKVLFKQNIAWVLNKMKIEFERELKIGDKLYLSTWPLTPKHFTADRDFLGKVNGEIIFRATSTWNMIDLQKRSLCSTDCVKDLPVEYHTKRVFDTVEYNRFKYDQEFTEIYTKTVRISDLDVNNHVNNTNYLTYALDCLSVQDYSKGIKAVEIRFSEELRYGDSVKLYYKRQDNLRFIIGKTEQDKTAFSVLVKLGE